MFFHPAIDAMIGIDLTEIEMKDGLSRARYEACTGKDENAPPGTCILAESKTFVPVPKPLNYFQ